MHYSSFNEAVIKWNTRKKRINFNNIYIVMSMDDTFDEDKLTEESYRTTFDTDPDALNMEAEDVSDDDDY